MSLIAARLKAGIMLVVLSWCFTSTEARWPTRDGEKGDGDMEVGGGRGRLYTYRYNVTTRMTPGLRRAAMRDILMFR